MICPKVKHVIGKDKKSLMTPPSKKPVSCLRNINFNRNTLHGCNSYPREIVDDIVPDTNAWLPASLVYLLLVQS